MVSILNLVKAGQHNYNIMVRCAAVLLGAFFIGTSAHAGDYVYSHKAYAEWLAMIQERAFKEGVSRKTASKALAGVKPMARIVELDRKQPETTLTFAGYMQRVLPKNRIEKARRLYARHAKLLRKIGNRYGVQPRFILALWGIESDFGEHMGNYYVPEALATLAFEGRRREFFTAELLKALKILDEGHITRKKMLGSWAGAMGQSQFMPSSFLAYAEDYNGDSRRDIWNTRGDALASIANYLAKTGWDKDATWGRKVTLPRNFDVALAGPAIEKDLAEWQKLGVRAVQGGNLPRRKLKASVALPDGKDGEAYLVYANYKTLLKWNKSLYFATAVGALADAIEK